MKRRMKVQDQQIKKEKFARVEFPTLQPRNEAQKLFMEALKYDTVVVCSGSAGAGKTLLACSHAARKLHFGDIRKIVLIRAYQPLAGRSVGFLPGSQTEKLLPYYQQMVDYLVDFLGKGTVDIHLTQGSIEICSLETIRGRSWDNCIVIVDEAQNLFVPEIQALCTRIGENCQMILCGDKTQTDVKNGMNGLEYLEKLTARYGIQGVEFVVFTRDDICRSGITKEFVIAFEEEVIKDSLGAAIVSAIEIDKQHKKGR